MAYKYFKTNHQYWQDRSKTLEQQTFDTSQKAYKDIEVAFEKSQKEIQAKIDAWLNRIALNNNVTLERAKEMLDKKELKEFKWDVQDYIKYGQENAIRQEFLKELENASAKHHIDKLTALKLSCQAEYEKAFAKENEKIKESVKNAYENRYDHTAYEIQKGFKVGFDMGAIDQNRLDKLIKKPWASDGENFSDRIWIKKDQMVDSLYQELVRNLVGERPLSEVVKTMTDYISKSTNNAKYCAARLVMTESAFFASTGQKDCYKDLGVEKYEIVATLDNHTSDICQGMDGQVFEMKDYEPGVTAPPFHVWCRSTTAPYFDDNFDIGERAARNPNTGKTYTVPGNITYKEWKAKGFGSTTSSTPVTNEGLTSKPKNNKIIKTREDAEEVLLNEIGFDLIEESLKKVDEELLIQNTERLRELESIFNAVHRSKGSICSESSGRAIAYVRSNRSNRTLQNLSLCPAYYKNKQKLLDEENRSINDFWSMPCKKDLIPVYTVTHEYGHMLFNVLFQEDLNNKKVYSHDEYTLNVVKEIKEIAKKKNPEFKVISKVTISEYGTTNRNEFLAEVFANSQCGEPNELGDAMNEWLKEKGIIK